MRRSLLAILGTLTLAACGSRDPASDSAMDPASDGPVDTHAARVVDTLAAASAAPATTGTASKFVLTPMTEAQIVASETVAPTLVPQVGPLPARVMLDEEGYITAVGNQVDRGSCTYFPASARSNRNTSASTG